MKIGVCSGLDDIRFVEKCQYDYLEPPLSALATMDEQQANEAIQRAQQASISCEAFNLFLPGGMKILGADVDEQRLHDYAETAFSRASKLGCEVVVFGSGGSRRLPEALAPSQAWKQMVSACRIFGDVAQKHGITIAIEPLNRKETDLVNTVAEGYDMVCDVAHPAIRLLADSYHMLLENESPDILKKAAPYLVHCHFACGKERLYPTLEDHCGFAEFISALQNSGYNKRVSIEGATKDFAKDTAESIAVFRTLG